MAWYHQDRRKLLAPVGEYRPQRVAVTIHDTFDQRRLDEAARQALGNGTPLAKFLLYAADHLIRHHPKLKETFREFERERREAPGETEGRRSGDTQPMGLMKTSSFTVHATAEQSIRWKRAAEAEGHRAAGTWLAAAADAYLKVRARAGNPLPLAWRYGVRFRVCLMDGQETEVRGVVSPPFGIYQGTSHGPDRNHLRTLVHLPTHRVIATLKTSAQCRVLASELAPVLLRGELPDPAPIVARHLSEAK